MGTIERKKIDQREDPADQHHREPAGDLSNLQQAGDDLLGAADDAINRALSGDSEAFLAANRQMGGE